MMISSCRFVRIRRNRKSSCPSQSRQLLLHQQTSNLARTALSSSQSLTSIPIASTILVAALAYFLATSLVFGPLSSSFSSPSSSPSARGGGEDTAALDGGRAKSDPEERRMIPFGRARMRTP